MRTADSDIAASKYWYHLYFKMAQPSNRAEISLLFELLILAPKIIAIPEHGRPHGCFYALLRGDRPSHPPNISAMLSHYSHKYVFQTGIVSMKPGLTSEPGLILLNRGVW